MIKYKYVPVFLFAGIFFGCANITPAPTLQGNKLKAKQGKKVEVPHFLGVGNKAGNPDEGEFATLIIQANKAEIDMNDARIFAQVDWHTFSKWKNKPSLSMTSRRIDNPLVGKLLVGVEHRIEVAISGNLSAVAGYIPVNCCISAWGTKKLVFHLSPKNEAVYKILISTDNSHGIMKAGGLYTTYPQGFESGTVTARLLEINKDSKKTIQILTSKLRW